MTLLDLCRLMKKNWLFIVIVPVVFALVAFGVICALPPVYSAGATLVTTSDSSLMNATGSSIAYRVSAETGLEVKTTVREAMTLTVTVRGANAQECVDVANSTAADIRERTLATIAENSEADEIAQQVKTAAAQALAGNESEGATSDDTAFYALALFTASDTTIAITEATVATDVSTIKLQYVVIAALAGLLLALVIVILRDVVRGTVHNVYEMEETYDVNLLGRVRASAKKRSGTAAEDEALLAALDFAGESAEAICLIPTESADSAKRIVTALEATAETAGKRLGCIGETGDLALSDPDALARTIASQKLPGASLTFVVAPPVAASADFAYLAPACGRAVLIVEAMRTRRIHVETVLRQLALSETDVAGFIMVEGA